MGEGAARAHFVIREVSAPRLGTGAVSTAETKTYRASREPHDEPCNDEWGPHATNRCLKSGAAAAQALEWVLLHRNRERSRPLLPRDQW